MPTGIANLTVPSWIDHLGHMHVSRHVKKNTIAQFCHGSVKWLGETNETTKYFGEGR